MQHTIVLYENQTLATPAGKLLIINQMETKWNLTLTLSYGEGQNFSASGELRLVYINSDLNATTGNSTAPRPGEFIVLKETVSVVVRVYLWVP